MHKVQVDVIRLQVLQRGCDTLIDALVPGVVKLGGEPDLLTRDSGIDDSLADLCFITVRESARVLSERRQSYRRQDALTCRCGDSQREAHP